MKTLLVILNYKVVLLLNRINQNLNNLKILQPNNINCSPTGSSSEIDKNRLNGSEID